MKETIIEPVLDSVAGNIEIAIFMATEIEDALKDIYRNYDQRVLQKSLQLHTDRNRGLLL